MMTKKHNALVTIVDEKHLSYVSQLYRSVVSRGLWQGDFIILAYNVSESNEAWRRYQDDQSYICYCPPLRNQGYHNAPPEVSSYFYLFSQFFTQWRNVIYLDVDCVVRSPLTKLANIDGFWASSFYHRNHPSFGVGDVLLTGKDLLNDGVMAYRTDIIKPDTLTRLMGIYNSLDFNLLSKIYQGGIDELVLTIYFLKQKRELPVVYNVIPNELRQRFNIPPRQVAGVIIHHATGNFYPKPWQPDSPWHQEWQYPDAAHLANRWWPAVASRIKVQSIIFFNLLKIDADRRLGMAGIWLKRYWPFGYKFLVYLKRLLVK